MSDCHLSTQGRAFSTILTAVVGSIVTGISDGPEVAFFIGWICWLAVVRIVIVSAAGILVTLFGPLFGIRQPFIASLSTSRDLPITRDEEIVMTPLAKTSENGNGNAYDVGAQVDISSTFAHPAGPLAALPAPGDEAIEVDSTVLKPADNPTDMDAPINTFSGLGSLSTRSHDVTFLGTMGWIYTFIWTPIMQVLWVKANWSLAPSALMVTRAVGVSVTALSYTIDTRARYGTALGKKFGSKKVVPRLMNLYSAVINMLLSIIVVVLLIRALDVSSKSELPTPRWIAAPYIFFSIIWAASSLLFLWPIDGGWAGTSTNTYMRIFLGLLVGAFAGVFVAAPSIVMWQDAKFESWSQKNGFPEDNSYYKDGKGLGSWLGCTTESWWKKAVQILP